MSSDFRPRYDAAIEAARGAGRIARQVFEGDFGFELKADLSPVTVADRNAERHIRDALTRHFPGDGFLGEEFGDEPSTTGFRWVIDPIDGTKSFIRKVPLWGTLVGLEYRGELVAGVAYVPMLDQMYHALRGHGAYRDGTRIRVSDVTKLADAHMCYSSVSWFTTANKERAFLDLAAGVSRSRGFGDFYGFCLVAQGSFDFMIDTGVHAWDIAALIPIVEEAGGRMTDWDDRIDLDRPDTLASNGKLHATVLAALK
jgi:histidinol-phosphatase